MARKESGREEMKEMSSPVHIVINHPPEPARALHSSPFLVLFSPLTSREGM
jgi:hypothetical protein